MVDAHHHLWDYNKEEFGWISGGMSVIRKSFLSSDLDPLLAKNEVSKAIAVQARTCTEENDFLLNQAKLSQTIQGVVGWIDLKSTQACAQLEQYASDPTFKGAREITQGAEDADYFTHSQFNAGIREITARDLTYDVLIFQNQLPAATNFIDQHPNQRFVLDHAAKPEIRETAFPTAWEKGLKSMAERENLVCKISGLATEVRDANWNSSLMERYFDTLLEAFGPSRLMFGSDWPVCLLASEYARWKDCVTQYISKLSQDEQHAVYTETATQFYSL